MTPHEATVANADLWTRYFQDQWSRWLDPLGVQPPMPEVAESTAARVAGLLTLVAAGPIAWMYAANAPHVAPRTDVTPVHAHAGRDEREAAAEERAA